MQARTGAPSRAPAHSPARFRFTREWEGQTAFIIAGGPSLAGQDIESLRGRRLIVINSSFATAPWADFLIFSDSRWYQDNRNRLAEFKGRILCVAEKLTDKRLLRLQRQKPPGLAGDAGTVTIEWTTLTAAINAAVHLGASRIVLLGADNKRGENGRCHHHAPHRWPLVDHCFPKQRADLESLVAPLKARGIEVVNCSPGSALPFWPVMSLADYLETERRAA